MDKNIQYATKYGYAFPVMLRLDDIKLLLEAFTNWMDTGEDNVWTGDGKAVNPQYRMVIAVLERKISELEG